MKLETKIGVKVGDIMTREPVTASPDISLQKAVKLMTKKRVGSLLLIESEELKGILTERDIMWALSKKTIKDLGEVRARDICTRKITTIRPSADLSDAIGLMRKKKYRRLPVVVKKRVIGYLTLKDILRIQPELFEIAKEHHAITEIREEEDKLKRKKAKEEFEEGICDSCGNMDILYIKDGQRICDDCRDSM